ncbi:MAG: Peptidase, partial [uncultured Sulfurovum sp.]
MFKSIVPITKERHLDKKVRAVDNFDFIKDVHIVSIMVHEFSRAASVYPIVFLEDQTKDEFKPVVLTGLEEGENLFVTDNKWEGSYIPAIIRRYPFALAKTDEDGRYTICIDEASDFVNDEEGQELFTKDGEA